MFRDWVNFYSTMFLNIYTHLQTFEYHQKFLFYPPWLFQYIITIIIYPLRILSELRILLGALKLFLICNSVH